MDDENKNKKSPIYDLYNKHKELRNEENYKNHQMVIEIAPKLDSEEFPKGVKGILENMEKSIEIVHEFDKCIVQEIEEEDTRPRFNSPGYGRVEK